jgi:hypothetical protein
MPPPANVPRGGCGQARRSRRLPAGHRGLRLTVGTRHPPRAVAAPGRAGCRRSPHPATTAWWGAIGAFALLSLFVVGISINLARGRTAREGRRRARRDVGRRRGRARRRRLDLHVLPRARREAAQGALPRESRRSARSYCTSICTPRSFSPVVWSNTFVPSSRSVASFTA